MMSIKSINNSSERIRSFGAGYKFKTDGTPKGDKIYPDFPEDFVTVKSFEKGRIGFQIISIANTNRSSNDSLQQKNLLIDFGVFAVNKLIEPMEQTLYNLIFANRIRQLFYSKLLRPSGRSSKEPYKKLSTTIIYSKLFSYNSVSQFEK